MDLMARYQAWRAGVIGLEWRQMIFTRSELSSGTFVVCHSRWSYCNS